MVFFIYMVIFLNFDDLPHTYVLYNNCILYLTKYNVLNVTQPTKNPNMTHSLGTTVLDH